MSSNTAPALATRTVLVVDDQKAMRHMVADMLRAFGIGHVHTAADGGEAMQQTLTWLPNLVITDWKMRPVDGVEYVRWLRRSDESPNRSAPVILLTGYNTHEHITAARDAGVNDVLIKPVSPKMLQRKVAAALAQKRQFVHGSEYIGPCRRRRRNLDYHGPLRRLIDPTDAELSAVDRDPDAIARVNNRAEALTALTRTLDVASRRQVRAFYDESLDARADARASRDRLLECAADSLVRYVEALGASGGLDREVVETHVCAITTLARLPEAREDLRRQVARDLGDLVAKRTATALGLTQNFPTAT